MLHLNFNGIHQETIEKVAAICTVIKPFETISTRAVLILKICAFESRYRKMHVDRCRDVILETLLSEEDLEPINSQK